MSPQLRLSSLVAAALVAVLALAAFILYRLAGRSLVLGRLAAATPPPSGGGLEAWRLRNVHAALADGLPLRLLVLGALALAALLALSRPALRRRLRGWRTGVAVAAAATLIGWLAVELLVAPFLLARLGLYRFYAVYDVDHRLPPHHRGIGTNGDGIRDPRPASAFTAPGVNLVFLGDSFTFGFGVEREEAFPARVEENLRRRFPALPVRVANFGWTSSSPHLALRQLHELGDRYHPDLVVYHLDMTDFHDDARQQAMLERRGVYAVFPYLPLALSLLERLSPRAAEVLESRAAGGLPADRFFVSSRPLDGSRRHLGPLVDSLHGLDDWCRARGVPFVLVVLPRTYQYDAAESLDNREAAWYEVLGPHALEPFRWVDEEAVGWPFPVVSLLPAFRETDVFPTAFEDDPHWTPAGHRVAAGAIADAVAPYVAAAATGSAVRPTARSMARSTADRR